MTYYCLCQAEEFMRVAPEYEKLYIDQGARANARATDKELTHISGYLPLTYGHKDLHPYHCLLPRCCRNGNVDKPDIRLTTCRLL
jgi:hypothetical protein